MRFPIKSAIAAVAAAFAFECSAAAFVSDAEYLDLVEAAVAAYSDEHVAEYVADADANGVNEHGFPRLTSNLGALVAAGRMPERKGLYRRMMDICCRDAKKGCMKKEGNEFSVKELVATLLEVEKAGLFPKSVTDGWRRDIAEIDPWKCYRCKPEPGNTKRSFNWAVFGAASEQTRIAAGMGGDAAFVERYVSDQIRWFDENGMWREPHEPFVYDMVTRLQFALILAAGYAGPSRDALSAHMDRGVEATLAMQSVSGEIPYGGRSNQFLHNDTFYAALCEWYAARFRARGDLKTAARFRQAAARAVEGLKRWLAERPVRHVKNRYPTGTGKRGTGIGCEAYAYFDKYMVTMGSWAIIARRFADSSPLPDVKEPETLAFATAPHFHVVCLRAGDYTAQFDYNSQAEYDCDGLGRIHRRGAPSAICMSVPCPAGEKIGYSTEVPNERTLSIAPVGEGTLQPAGSGDDAEGAWANWKQGALDWKCRLTRKGLESELIGSGDVAMSLPAFEFDGETATRISCDGKTLTIRYRGWICAYSTDGEIVDTGIVCCNRNGRYRAFEARGKGRLSVKVTIDRLETTCLCGEAPERARDFFWENDRVGFRAYGPGDFHRWSGIDVFNKATPYNFVVRLLRERGRHRNWHKNTNGVCFDNYTVGAGRGVGAVAVRGDGEWKTYPNWDRCEVATNSDELCEFKLEYPAFSGLGRMTYRVTLRRGDPFFRNEVSFELKGKMPKDFCAGPGLDVNPGRGHGGDLFEDRERGIVSLFEDAKGGNEGSTMVAVFLEDASDCELETDHMGCRVLATRRPSFVYWAGALWDGEGSVRTAAEWHALVRDFKDKLKEKGKTK